ncbi:MAG: hypothetical protein HQL51_08775 [Magnetococcales bacterium]|nr:hypothetical protein [Magnetococcales bacterium]
MEIDASVFALATALVPVYVIPIALFLPITTYFAIWTGSALILRILYFFTMLSLIVSLPVSFIWWSHLNGAWWLVLVCVLAVSYAAVLRTIKGKIGTLEHIRAGTAPGSVMILRIKYFYTVLSLIISLPASLLWWPTPKGIWSFVLVSVLAVAHIGILRSIKDEIANIKRISIGPRIIRCENLGYPVFLGFGDGSNEDENILSSWFKDRKGEELWLSWQTPSDRGNYLQSKKCIIDEKNAFFEKRLEERILKGDYPYPSSTYLPHSDTHFDSDTQTYSDSDTETSAKFARLADEYLDTVREINRRNYVR